MTFRKILCPTDFSDDSRAALAECVDLAKAAGDGAEILVVHASPPSVSVGGLSVPGMMIPGDSAEIQRARDDALTTLVADVVQDRVPCRVIKRTGEPWSEIAAAADEEGADVIVIAPHVASALERFVLGSTTAKLLRGSHVPVLVWQRR